MVISYYCIDHNFSRRPPCHGPLRLVGTHAVINGRYLAFVSTTFCEFIACAQFAFASEAYFAETMRCDNKHGAGHLINLWGDIARVRRLGVVELRKTDRGCFFLYFSFGSVREMAIDLCTGFGVPSWVARSSRRKCGCSRYIFEYRSDDNPNNN